MDHIEQLPTPGVRWKAVDVVPESGAPLNDVTLYYRNPVDAIRTLLSRPDLKEAMEFTPRRVWETSARTDRLYTELFTGEWAYRTQVCASSLAGCPSDQCERRVLFQVALL
jgi:hypothetical protein